MKNSLRNPAPIGPTSDAPNAGTQISTSLSRGNLRGTLVKKKNTAAGDPYAQPMSKRVNVMGHSGAKYGIRAKVQGGIDPAAGATLGNGRIFTAAVNRTAPNFTAGYSNLD